MAGATIIDQLIVKLGLDPRDFTKGQKEAARAITSTEQDVKKSSDSMSRSLVGVAGKLLGVASAAVAVKKAVSYVSQLSTSVRQLGIDSRNFGVAAGEMRNFQNIGEMMGGKAEEVTKSIGGITKAVYDLAYNGQMSDSLIMLARLGVGFQTATGAARPFRDIVLDTQDEIQKLMKNGTSRENANQMLAQAGFDPGLSRAILDGTVREQLAQQEGRRQVTGESLTSAEDWEKSAANRDQAIAAATLRALPNAAKGGVALNDALASGAEMASNATLAGGAQAIGEAMNAASEKIKVGADKMVSALENMGDRMRSNLWVKGRGNYEDTIQSAARKHDIDPEELAGILSTESNFDPSAVSPAGAKGIAQLMPKYFPNAGKNPHEDIETAAAYYASLKQSFLKEGNDDSAASYLALQSYNAGQSRVRKSMNGGKPLAQETLDYPGKVLGYAASAVPSPGAQAGQGGAGVSTVDVSMGNVVINTQATDANGIAKDFASEVRRKTMAAQADAGVN